MVKTHQILNILLNSPHAPMGFLSRVGHTCSNLHQYPDCPMLVYLPFRHYFIGGSNFTRITNLIPGGYIPWYWAFVLSIHQYGCPKCRRRHTYKEYKSTWKFIHALVDNKKQRKQYTLHTLYWINENLVFNKCPFFLPCRVTLYWV